MELLKVFILLSGLACAKAMNFKEWKDKYGYHIDAKYEAKRHEAFNKTVASIKKHNSDSRNSYRQKVGEAAGMTEHERNVRRGFRFSENRSRLPEFQVTITITPFELNFTSQMSPIKNQGRCGSCWVMSSTATLEFRSPKRVFSDQGVLDCNKRGFGCKGGSPQTAFLYAMNSGLSNGHQYQYFSGQTGNTNYCRIFEFPPIYNLTKACFVALNGNETLLRFIVAQFGPVVVTINSRNSGLDHYDSGVFSSRTCSKALDDADHAVTIVGYGTDGRFGDFWIVRNSWGTDFGQNGYFQIKRGCNMCGIGNRAWGPC